MSNEFNAKNGLRIQNTQPVSGISNTTIINNDNSLVTEGQIYRELTGKTDLNLFTGHTGDTTIHFTKESLNSIFVNVSGDTLSGTLYGTSISANTMSATTFYGDGSQLTGIDGIFPPTNIVYCDSNASIGGDGTIGKPYTNVTDVVEVFVSFTGNTTLNNATITTIVDTSSINVGDIVGGTGVAWEARVLSKTVNSITLDIVCTANGTAIALKSITPKKVIVTGNHTITGNCERMNVVEWDFQNSNIQFGNTTVFNKTVTRIANFKVSSGNWSGTHANSKLYDNGVAQSVNHYLIFKPIKVTSIGTGYILDSPNFFCGNFRIDSDAGIIASAGKVCNLIAYSGIFDGYKYGLLGGVQFQGSAGASYYVIINGITESPSAINAVINGTNSYRVEINGVVKGSILGVAYANTIINARVVGTNINLPEGDQIEINNETFITTGTISTRGHFTHKGMATGTWNLSGGGVCTMENLAGAVSINGGTNNRIRMCNNYTGNNGNITLTNSAQVVIENTQYISEYAYQQISIASGCILINDGYLRGRFLIDMGGTFINKGEFVYIDAGSTAITGVFEQTTSGKLLLRSSGGRYTELGYQSTIWFKNGSKGRISGFIDASLLSNYPAIKKDATSQLTLNNLDIKTYQNKSIIECTTNAVGSTDIIAKNVTTDANGTSYGLEFAYNGSSFAPTFLIKNSLNESNTYTAWIG